MSTRSKGTVKYSDASRGFGYITRPNQPNLFFSHRHLLGDMPKAPQKGDVLMFDEVRGQRGMIAVNICNLSDPESVRVQDAWLTRARQVERTDWSETRARLAAHFKKTVR